jgi:hypothetical protein
MFFFLLLSSLLLLLSVMLSFVLSCLQKESLNSLCRYNILLLSTTSFLFHLCLSPFHDFDLSVNVLLSSCCHCCSSCFRLYCPLFSLAVAAFLFAFAFPFAFCALLGIEVAFCIRYGFQGAIKRRSSIILKLEILPLILIGAVHKREPNN